MKFKGYSVKIKAGAKIKAGELLFIKRKRVYPISTEFMPLKNCLNSIPVGVCLKSTRKGAFVEVGLRGVLHD